MILGWALSELFINCQNKEQANTVFNKFHKDIFPRGPFALWNPEHEPFKWKICLVDNDVAYGFDEEVLAMFDWFRNNFSLPGEGFWLFEGDDGHYRCEVKDGKVIYGCLDWLSEYTIEQINELHKYAEDKYKSNLKG